MRIDHKKYLDKLRESGVVNMFGAEYYVAKYFQIDRHEARNIVIEWMRTFNDDEVSE